ncbi:MAG: insulinase family protein [Cytophagaceae bacterium]|nr:insulinase family protein [Cytophagaceae bacterium]
MIEYKYFSLDNGLKVYVHEDHSTPLVAFNLLYNVGARDEDEHKTGFAHLFEHLMFGGSKHIPSFDEPLQNVGGENNAFTSNDITNYYILLPAANIETAFWLESDRMLSLSFDPEVLEVQRNVVIEEFKQRYLNQPYGDVWMHLRKLAFAVHPYKWSTIGKEISHIENATMEDVKNFFYKYYIPNNAYLVVAGNVKADEVKRLSEKWFGTIPAGKPYIRNLPKEPKQDAPRKLEVEADVPLNAIYKVYHMCSKVSDDYYATDLLSDVLGRGKSSRLYEKLVKEKRIFNSVHSHVLGSIEPGLLVIDGKLNQGVSFEEAEGEILKMVEEIKSNVVSESELTKVKNQAESSIVFESVELMNRAMNLAFAAILGDPDLVNKDPLNIQKVTSVDIKRIANEVLMERNCSTLYYKAKKN